MFPEETFRLLIRGIVDVVGMKNYDALEQVETTYRVTDVYI